MLLSELRFHWEGAQGEGDRNCQEIRLDLGAYNPAVRLKCSDTDIASSHVWATFLLPPSRPGHSPTHGLIPREGWV